VRPRGCYRAASDRRVLEWSRENGLRLELLDRLNGATGAGIPADKITKRPTIALSVLDQAGGERFLKTLHWIVGTVRAS
jgi:hypothetical protein